jgi:hypothetical protein
MMDVDVPPPPKSMAARVRDLAPGQSIAFRGSATSVNVTVSRIRAQFPEREYVTKTSAGVTRVWRLAEES